MGNNHTLSGTDPAIGTSKSERMTIACILLFDEIRDQWELNMFCAAPAIGENRCRPKIRTEKITGLSSER